MEPFGILQFLQSLLPNPTPSEGAQPPPPSQADAPAEDKTQDLKEQNTDAQEAYISFLQAHENRAKRTKRN